MLNKIIAIAMLLGLGQLVYADTVAVNPDHPDQYVVQKGDTLWDISGRFLTEPWRWPEIWQANPQINDPHLIYPGDLIALSYADDGSPVLTVQRADESGAETVQTPAGGRTVKLSPAMRSHDRLGDSIPSIPIDAIQQFLTHPLVVSEEEMADWPYIVSSYEEHLVAGPGNKVYIRNLPSGASGNRYSLYRRGGEYKRESGEVLGYEALYVGDVVIERDGQPSTGVIVQATREVLNGDRLLAQSSDGVSTDFIPRSPGGSVEGNIISVIDGFSQISQYQVVVLDIGQSDGIEIGNVLGVYQSGRVVRDKIKGRKGQALDDEGLAAYLGSLNASGEQVELPEEYAGVLMVFRTFGNVSFALVMETRKPLALYDTVANL